MLYLGKYCRLLRFAARQYRIGHEGKSPCINTLHWLDRVPERATRPPETPNLLFCMVTIELFRSTPLVGINSCDNEPSHWCPPHILHLD